MPPKRPPIHEVHDSSSDETPPRKKSKPLVNRPTPSKPSTQSAHIPDPKPAPAIKLVVNLDSKFDVFPFPLRKELIRQYHVTINMQMQHFRNALPHGFTMRYSINHATCVCPSSSDFQITNISSNQTCRATVNTILLEMFLTDNETKRNALGTLGAIEAAKFVHLPTQGGIANPEFLQLHSVRYGEIGWGWDCNGCLSLYMTEMVEKKRRIEALFVERVKVKVEEG